jgi:uncharacterized membrane protein YeaQ/YmgE (transglycosylase-associated protein family)
MIAFLAWIIVGLLAGFLARALVPGPQPMGLFWTTCFGCAGSIFGGLISMVVWGSRDGFHPAGLLMSTFGAALLLAAFVSYARRRFGPR